jgi:hypothetical protein
MTLRRLMTFGVTACALIAPTLGTLTPAAVATSATAWQIKQGADPTILPPGSTNVAQYHLLITNVGSETAPAGTTVTDTVSAGLTPVLTPVLGSPDKPLASLPTRSGEKSIFPCTITGQTVTCEIKTRAVLPGEQIDVYVPVAVAADPPATVSNEVTVSSPGVPPASSSLQSRTGEETPPFAFSEGPLGLSGSVFDEAGATPPAGAHPFDVELSARVSTVVGASGMRARDPLRALQLEMPAGLVANPLAVKERCTLVQLQEAVAEAPITACPPSSQVGIVHFSELGSLEGATAPLIDMVPPPGVPAEFAFDISGIILHIRGGLAGNFHLTAGSEEITAKFPIPGIKVDLWGIPSDPRHDPQRGGEGIEHRCGEGGAPCSIEPSPVPFLTMPTSCTEAVTLGATASGWLGSATADSRLFEDAEGNPTEVNGCNALQFTPTITSKATTNLADSPSGLDFNLHQPQNQQLEGLATAALKDARVTLPAGMTLNASAANGLDSCTESQIGYAPEAGKIRFSTAPQTCPNAAKVGTLEVKTPLLKEKLPGAVYLARPYANPFANLTAIYLAIEDPEAGIVAKLAGKVEADPVTGQLSTSFEENPELPVEDIDLHLFNGATAALTTPLTCGTKTTTSVLTPWSTPEGADVPATDSFETQVPAGGSGACPTSEATAPNNPSFTAGTIAPEAGAYSPFVLRLARPDGTQRLTGIDTVLPKGLAAKFAGIPYCSEAQIAQAKSREAPNQGALEKASPSCPLASEVGTVEVGAGSGPTPFYTSGHAYLAGPYKGAPLSLAIITPAVAGPFDLGAVVVRTALYVNSETAQGHAVSDPFPSIIAGVPLDIRSVAIKLDRPGGFTLNPTSCDPMAVTGSVTALTGQSAALTSPFQVGGCSALKFKPNLAISLKGGTKRHRFPALKAVLTYPKGQNANIASAQVTLPHSAFLEQSHIGTVCTRVQFAADACPKASIYGKARAITPLLDKPLEGPVYLRSSSHELPDLVAALHGQIDVDLVGRVDTGKGGGIRNTFEAAPDAPVSKFVLEMKGGSKGLLVNSEDICRKPQRASVSFTAQNGKAFAATPLIKNSCGGKAKKRGAKKGHGGKR